MIRVHRDRWRAFLLSFLRHEGVVALKVLFELWDISGDCFAFATVKGSGQQDLFIPFAVFLVPSLGFSVASIGLKLWLLKRRTAQRMDVRHALRSAPMDFRLLCDLFMLRTSQRQHEEDKSANDGARKLLSTITQKIHGSRAVFDAQAVGNSLYGLQHMSSDHIEVRDALTILAEKAKGCEEILNAQEVGNALYGMQSISSDCPEVLEILRVFTEKVAGCTEMLNVLNFRRARVLCCVGRRIIEGNRWSRRIGRSIAFL
jgi:hypothetical protein